MKKATAIFIFFFTLTTTLSSQTWAPVGTKWYYSDISWGFPWTNSPRIIESTGDTIINGKQCRIITGNCSCGFSTATNYMYYENDKIFMYIDSTIGFHVLYDFTAGAGDTLTIIAPNPFVGDTSQIYIDSVGTKIFSGDTFSVQYIHNLNYNDLWVFVGYSYNIKGIGNSFCFFPQYAACDPWTGPIRCFEDSSKTISFTNITCDTTIYTVSTNEIYWADKIKIYPNPTGSNLSIEFPNQNCIEYDYELYSSIGDRLILMTGLHENKFEIPLIKFRNGLYFLKITTSDGQSLVKKIIKE